MSSKKRRLPKRRLPKCEACKHADYWLKYLIGGTFRNLCADCCNYVIKRTSRLLVDGKAPSQEAARVIAYKELLRITKPLTRSNYVKIPQLSQCRIHK